jgi:hypothetical protein
MHNFVNLCTDSIMSYLDVYSHNLFSRIKYVVASFTIFILELTLLNGHDKMNKWTNETCKQK